MAGGKIQDIWWQNRRDAAAEVALYKFFTEDRLIPEVCISLGERELVPKLISWIVRHQGWFRGIQVERETTICCQ
jgi:hypothetical protein